MRHFVQDEEGYDRWVQNNPRGLVFARKKLNHYMVDMADCDHIAWFGPRTGTAGTWKYTAPPGKWCSERRGDAAAWVVEHGFSTVDCRDCAPAFRPQRDRKELPGNDHCAPPAPGVVREGSVVEVMDPGDQSTAIYRLGEASSTRSDARPLKLETAVAQALMGHQAGDKVDVSPPHGAAYGLQFCVSTTRKRRDVRAGRGHSVPRDVERPRLLCRVRHRTFAVMTQPSRSGCSWRLGGWNTNAPCGKDRIRSVRQARSRACGGRLGVSISGGLESGTRDAVPGPLREARWTLVVSFAGPVLLPRSAACCG